MPWQTNAYLKLAEEVAVIVRKKMPYCKVILSTWGFDRCYWDELFNIWRDRRPEWIAYLLVENTSRMAYIKEQGSPADIPVVGFPEIAMNGMFPWGGYGANPNANKHWLQHLNHDRHMVGGWPYSEHIQDDILKFLFANLYWDNNRTLTDILREYISYEFSPLVVKEVITAINIFEGNHLRYAIDESSEYAWEMAQRANAKLPDNAKKSFRWRFIYLRALIDYEMFNLREYWMQPLAEGISMSDFCLNFSNYVKNADPDSVRRLKGAFDELRKLTYAENVSSLRLKPIEISIAAPNNVRKDKRNSFVDEVINIDDGELCLN